MSIQQAGNSVLEPPRVPRRAFDLGSFRHIGRHGNTHRRPVTEYVRAIESPTSYLLLAKVFIEE